MFRTGQGIKIPLPMTDYKSNCWASPLADCGGKISREHLISQALFEEKSIVVKGLDWCSDEAKTIGLSSLVAKILCEKHNSSLSDLDSAALDAFDVLRETVRLNSVRGKLGSNHWSIKRFVIDGKRLERWFLKTLINLSFKGRHSLGACGWVQILNEHYRDFIANCAASIATTQGMRIGQRGRNSVMFGRQNFSPPIFIAME